MDLRDALLGLVAPTAIGQELARGARLVRASTEAGLRLAFEVEGEEVLVEVAPADAAAPSAAASARLRFAYIAQGPIGRARGLALCRAVAQQARANEVRVLDALAREADLAGQAPRLREVRVDRLLEEVTKGAVLFHTLSPYVGCIIGCRFCYAQSHVALARRFAGLPVIPWGSYVDARVNAAEVLAGELEAQHVRIIKFCPIVSDPYQAAEARFGITRACIQVIAEARLPPAVLVLTRSRLVARDAPLLGGMRARVGVSIPTVDDDVRRHFEPRAASVRERLEVLSTLRAAGASTFAVVQPLLPGPVDALADALATHCGSVRLGVLEGLEQSAEDFADPRFSVAASPSWQQQQAQALSEALRSRGIPLWAGELPPDL